MTEKRLFAPAVARNTDAIYQVLAPCLADASSVLEIASGSGEHIVHFARKHPDVFFQPTDYDINALESIRAWISFTGLCNLRQPVSLDTTTQGWNIEPVDLITCFNMIHIAPIEACKGLISGAATRLATDKTLFFYGPFLQNGIETAQGNINFDISLKSRNPLWGIRQLETVAELAANAGFSAPCVTAMPANNLCVAFTKL